MQTSVPGNVQETSGITIFWQHAILKRREEKRRKEKRREEKRRAEKEKRREEQRREETRRDQTRREEKRREEKRKEEKRREEKRREEKRREEKRRKEKRREGKRKRRDEKCKMWRSEYVKMWRCNEHVWFQLFFWKKHPTLQGLSGAHKKKDTWITWIQCTRPHVLSSSYSNYSNLMKGNDGSQFTRIILVMDGDGDVHVNSPNY